MSLPSSLLLLLLLWGTACAGVWGSQAGTGADKESPSSPRFLAPYNRDYELQVQETVTVREGLCVSIPCTFSYPRVGWSESDPAHGYWFRISTNALSGAPVATNNPAREVEEGTRGRFQLLGDPRDGSCSLLVREARRRDADTYFFRVERGDTVKYSYLRYIYMVTLRVTAQMQKPDIYSPETLEPGRPVMLLCVFPGYSEGCPPPTFSWSGMALSSQRAAPRNTSFSVLPLNPRPQDHNTWLTCRVEFGSGVRASNSIQLRVAHAPKNLGISFSLTRTSVRKSLGKDSRVNVTKGQFLRLLCGADGHPPPTLSWVLNDRVLSWSSPSGPRSLVLERPEVGPEDSGRYTCQAENRLGFQKRWLDLSVQYLPENLRVMVSGANRTALENLTHGMTLSVLEGQSLRLICVADSSPPATLSWDWGRRPLSPSQSSHPVLELPQVQKEDEGEVTCRAQNGLGSQQVTLRLSVLYPPELLGPSCSQEAEGLRCSCSARARPAPSLRWWVGDRLVAGNSSNASVTVTSSEGPRANSSLTLHEGLSPDLGLHCEARNDHGVHRVTVLRLPGSPEHRGGSVQAAALGAGLTALLSLCSCLIFLMVKTCRTKKASTAAGGSDGRSVLSDTSRGHQCELQPGKPRDASPVAVATSPSGEEDQDLHYASLVFQGLKPREPRDQETTSTSEYSEIKISGLKPREPRDQEATSTSEYSEIKISGLKPRELWDQEASSTNKYSEIKILH